MKILVVDDLRTFTEFEATYARDWQTGLDLIRNDDWDVVFLDHDLGAEDIRPLVRWLAEEAFNNNLVNVKQFYCCSDNPAGSSWVIGTLKNWYPIEWNQPRFKVDWSAYRA